MRTIQSSFAKTHFAQILDEVEKGETVQITRHGRVVAKIVPQEERAEAERRRAAFDAIARFRKETPLTGITVDDLLSARDEGRK